MTNEETKVEVRELPPLTDYEIGLLEELKTFPRLDKSSQERLRRAINDQRKISKTFEQAFGEGLSNGLVKHQNAPKSEVFGNMIDIILHPITAIKGKIGETMLKSRNKAPEILIYPHPILSKVAEEWNFYSGDKAELLEIVRKLGAALRNVNYGGRLGMAAPQIGISKRIFVCQGAVCINPKFTPPKVDTFKEEVIEGCYSVKGKLYKTSRSRYGWAEWYSVDGVQRKFKLKNIDAIVFQHELDHLDGKCCCDVGVEFIPPKESEQLKDNVLPVDAK